MSFQTQINVKQAVGVEGEFYDDSPRRVHTYLLKTNPAEAVAATGEVTLGAAPTADDTVSIAGKTYKFVASPASANDVKIGSGTEYIANLVAAINGASGAGTTYGTGTVANAYVSAAAGSGKVTLTAKTAGAIGNAIGLSASFTSASNEVVAFSGGVDGGSNVIIGRAFTSTEEGKAITGGEGVFVGILVSPKEHALTGVAGNPLGATLTLRDGNGSLATMGHIIVRVAKAVTIEQQAEYNKLTGQLAGVNAGSSADSGYVLIPNSKFVFFDGQENGLAVVELGA